ncbi:CD99 antigen-like protein 2 [Melanotaenia boesemani]|uniref:CD99 antigen-like protein 2 n=1 Tax=Melanotaenia boesemani TaxID=1250792 RepID=UPI001C04095F|nr:CD99 antigen-like protein 2 [Melanotaenia boesemani]
MDYRFMCALCLSLQLMLLPLQVLSQGDMSLSDALDGEHSKPSADDFDLADALDPKKDIGFRDKNKGQKDAFSDKDLIAVSEDNTYKPDKGKGGRSDGNRGQINKEDDTSETTAEVGTIAGIVSAVAMALVGAISSYISYQKKKLCFSIQQSLNVDMTKADNSGPVAATEPQVQQTLLEPPNAEPPAEVKVVL